MTVLACYDPETGMLNRWVKETHTKLIRTHTADILPPEEWTEAAIPLDVLIRVFRQSPADEHRVGVCSYAGAGLLA